MPKDSTRSPLTGDAESNDGERPGRVWALLMFDPPKQPRDDWPVPAVLLGMFASRAAAVAQLASWCPPEEQARMRWVRPEVARRLNPDYHELRGAAPFRRWFSLEAVEVRERGDGADRIWVRDGGATPLTTEAR